MMEMRVKVFDRAELRTLFMVAPEQYRRALLGWLIRERGSFVGDKTKDGAFTRTILSKKLSTGGEGGKWSRSVAKAFKGYINSQDKIEGMTLRMGMNLSGRSKFAGAIAAMEEGYTQTTSKMMIVPNYEYLPFKRPRKLALQQFKEMIEDHKLRVVRQAGRLLFFEIDPFRRLLSTPGKDKLYFIGTRSIRVPKQYEFIPAWQRRLPDVLDRGQKSIDRATEKLARGGIG